MSASRATLRAPVHRPVDSDYLPARGVRSRRSPGICLIGARWVVAVDQANVAKAGGNSLGLDRVRTHLVRPRTCRECAGPVWTSAAGWSGALIWFLVVGTVMAAQTLITALTPGHAHFGRLNLALNDAGIRGSCRDHGPLSVLGGHAMPARSMLAR